MSSAKTAIREEDGDSASELDQFVVDARNGCSVALDRLCELLTAQFRRQLQGRKLEGLDPARTASDLIQETVLRAREKFSQFDKESYAEFVRWARGILDYRYRDWMRAHRTQASERMRIRIWFATVKRRDLGNEERPRLPEDELERDEECAQALAAFQKLNPHEQNVINLRVVERLRFKEIASLAKNSEDAVRKAYARAIDRLRSLFESNEKR